MPQKVLLIKNRSDLLLKILLTVWVAESNFCAIVRSYIIRTRS